MKSLTTYALFALSLVALPAAARSNPASPQPSAQPCDSVCPSALPVHCGAQLKKDCPFGSDMQPCTVCPEECESCTPAPCYGNDAAPCGRQGNRRHAPRKGMRIQPRVLDPDKADALSQRAFRGMDLTPSQQAAIQSLSEQRAAESKKLAEEMQKKRSKMQEKYDKKLQKILTPEQYAKYKERRGKVRRGPALRPDGVVGPVVPGPKPTPMTDK